MSRLYRFDSEGALHHVMTRGVEKRSIVLDDSDRDDFTRRLKKCSSETGMRIHAWVLMPNHIHLLTETGTSATLARFMQKLLTGHAVRFNRKHERVGHLFQGRYRAILVQKESYFTRLLRYIHLNPLKAGMVSSICQLTEYRWSGHAGILDPATHPWQTISLVKEVFGEGSSGRENYLEYLEQADPLDEVVFDGGNFFIGADGLVERSTGSEPAPTMDTHLPILGDRRFLQDIMVQLNPSKGHPATRERAEEHLLAMRIVYEVESGLGLQTGILGKRGGGPSRTTGRELASYCLIELLGMTMKDASGILGVSRQGVYASSRRFCLKSDVNDPTFKSVLKNVISFLQRES